MPGYRLFACKGTGSMIVEAAAALAGIAIEVTYIPWENTGWESAELHALNPTGQTPTLILPDGRVMTESAAIILHFADLAPAAKLAPAGDDPLRPDFLRWLIFLVAAIYPTFTYGDRPERWLPGHAEAGKALTKANLAHRKKLFRAMEAAAQAPFFLGKRMSVVDLYIWAMSYWRPRDIWFRMHTPKLFAIAERVGALVKIRTVAARNGLSRQGGT